MSVLRHTTAIGVMTLLSRVSGMVRDMVYSRVFGAGPLMDAFFVAFKIPNFLRRLSAEGAFSQAFVPVVSEYKVKRSSDEVKELVGGVAGTLGVVLFVATLIGVIAAPALILIFAPGFRFEGGRFELAVEMLRWTFPYIFFISLVSLYSGVLNSYGRFGSPAFNPVLMNLVMIVAALLAATYASNPGIVLSIGVFVSGVVQLVFLWPFVARLHVMGRPRWRWDHEGVRRVARLMLPGIFGSSVAQVSLLLDSLIASFMMVGSISWLYYADRLVEFPMGVFSIALATVILPRLSTHHAEESPGHFAETLDSAVRLVFLLATPAAVALLVLAGPLITTIYGYGEFTDRDVRMTTYALMMYALGLLGFSMVKVLAPGYFARQDPRTPVRVGMISLGVNIGFNVLVVLPLALSGFPAPHVLLAFSTGMGAVVNSTLLYRGLRRAGVYHAAPGWRKFALQVLVANIVMGIALWWLGGGLDSWLAYGSWQRAQRLGLCVLAGVAVYFATLWASGMRYRELSHIAGK
ncbi:MAG TPA: murein biosynthesis integral membrane protein MurJ [Steroidobacteraceae bacterium]|nr:murein biosynthesis integral membrane protein MurJ [Steroidobacteraceae bacterium]